MEAYLLDTSSIGSCPGQSIHFFDDPRQFTHHLINLIFAPQNNVSGHQANQHNSKDVDESGRVRRANRIGLVSIGPDRFDTFSNITVIQLVLWLVPDGMDERSCCCE